MSLLESCQVSFARNIKNRPVVFQVFDFCAFDSRDILSGNGHIDDRNCSGQDIDASQRIVHKVCVELFACAPIVHTLRLNLLIIDAHAGVPLDIRPGGATELALQASCPGVVVQYEEPEQNCHLLASVSDMSVLHAADAELVAFKVDVSITRLGKLIFRISHSDAALATGDYWQEGSTEKKVREACARVVKDVSPSTCTVDGILASRW